MKAKEIAAVLSKFPEFDVEFGFLDNDGSEYGVNLRVFNVSISDIGYSSRVIKLSSEGEKK